MTALPAQLEIKPLPGPFDCTGEHALRLPGSKSITNRAFILAALADGETTLDGVLFSDDTRVMMQALGQLGFRVKIDEPNRRVTVVGRGGRIPRSDVELFCGNSGTTIRFLTALCCLDDPGHRHVLTGIPRMLERPIGELVDMLRQLGARIDYLGNEGYPPIRIHGGIRGGELTVKPTLSSQYITALLQIAPYLENGLKLNFDGAITSRPYVEMTFDMIRQWQFIPTNPREAGILWETNSITVKPMPYQPSVYQIEPDASNASYFVAATQVTPQSHCNLEGIVAEGLQGDSKYAFAVRDMGLHARSGLNCVAVHSFGESYRIDAIDDIDLNDMPDMAQTLAVVALFAEGTTVIRNVGNLRVKETDRMAALQKELSKFGASVVLNGDDIHITPPPADASQLPFTPGSEVVIETYDDHRMAMAFTVAGLASDRLPGQPRVVIDDPACVNKTFPDFFDYINELRTNSERYLGTAEA